MEFGGLGKSIRPNIRRWPATGPATLVRTAAAAKVAAKVKRTRAWPECSAASVVRAGAVAECKKIRVDSSDEINILGEYKIQFGTYRGQSFRWLAENDVGYGAFLAADTAHEPTGPAPLHVNKACLRKYFGHFPLLQAEVDKKGTEKAAKRAATAAAAAAAAAATPPPRPVPTRTAPPRPVPLRTAPPGPAPLATRPLREVFSKVAAHLAQIRSERSVATARRPILSSPRLPSSSSSGEEDGKLWKAAEEAENAELAGTSATDRRRGDRSNVGVPAAPPQPKSAVPPDPSPSAGSTRPPRPPARPLAPVATVPGASSGSTGLRPPAPAPLPTSDPQKKATGSPSRSPTRKAAATSPPSSPARVRRQVTTPPGSPDKKDVPTFAQMSSNLLPTQWRLHIDERDQAWISKALFDGRSHLKPQVQLWYHPPQPPLIYNQPPASPAPFFGRRFFLWMPYRMWKMQLRCVRDDCAGRELTSCGLYKTVRQVIDIDSVFYMGAEYLECGICHKKYAAWSTVILDQMDVGHRTLFPALLTYRYACSNRLLLLLRERGLGNSVGQLFKKLCEQHSEAWLARTAQYLTACRPFFAGRLTRAVQFQRPPAIPALPRPKWLLSVYARDVLQRLGEVKAKVTATYGSIIKMDSTKRVTKKLAGASAKTAAWATNVGNEHGQVLITVLTCAEGSGLTKMASGLMQRYRKAGEDPPVLIYVDRDCCALAGESAVRAMFADWDAVLVRLDIWHFMRRLGSCCTTEAHQLYGPFMGQLSAAIFVWDPADVDALCAAKRSQLKRELAGVTLPDDEVRRRLSRRELALHCRRTTRGVEETTRLLQHVIATFTSDQGRDMLGVPLLDKEKMEVTWASQQRHVACIQDAPRIQLYTQTGTLKKGDVVLPTYRCARGSNSLESFHCHLARFIPGTSASDVHFQAYLLEGIVRWNDDRAAASVKERTALRSYSGQLKRAVNDLSTELFGESAGFSTTDLPQYTGELIGMEYLYDQTGQVLKPPQLDPDVPEEEDDLPDLAADEGFEDAEDLDDDPTLASVQEEARAVETTAPSDRPSPPVTPPPPSSPPPSPPPSITVTRSVPGPSAGSTELRASPPAAAGGPSSSPPPPSPPRSSSPVPSAGAGPTGDAAVPSSGPTDESVGPRGIPGYSHVQALAEYLVSLREGTLSLSQQQVETVTGLWANLAEYDRRRVVYSPRHKDRLVRGRFGGSKQVAVLGVDSVKRSFIGTGSVAQWPDASRIVEAVCAKLCVLHPGPVRQPGGRRIDRWVLISSAYKTISDLVTTNDRLMRDTTLQLYHLNSKTLLDWYNKGDKGRESLVLSQGMDLNPGPLTASEPLPAPKQLLALPPPYRHPGPAHDFALPEDTQGKATRARKPYRRGPSSATPAAATATTETEPEPEPEPEPEQQQPPPQQPPRRQRRPATATGTAPPPRPTTSATSSYTSATGAGAAAAAPTPRVLAPDGKTPPQPGDVAQSTAYRRKRRMESGMLPAYSRAAPFNRCKTCGQPRLKATGHRCCGGYLYCPSGGLDYDAWKLEVEQIVAAKKRKKD